MQFSGSEGAAVCTALSSRAIFLPVRIGIRRAVAMARSVLLRVVHSSQSPCLHSSQSPCHIVTEMMCIHSKKSLISGCS
eukprot:4089054-Amphidinium_carterae.1